MGLGAWSEGPLPVPALLAHPQLRLPSRSTGIVLRRGWRCICQRVVALDHLSYTSFLLVIAHQQAVVAARFTAHRQAAGPASLLVYMANASGVGWGGPLTTSSALNIVGQQP